MPAIECIIKYKDRIKENSREFNLFVYCQWKLPHMIFLFFYFVNTIKENTIHFIDINGQYKA